MFSSLCEDIRASKARGDALRTGHHYMEAKRVKWRPKADPLSQLDELLDETLDIDPKLMKAITATQRKVSDKEPCQHSFGHPPPV